MASSNTKCCNGWGWVIQILLWASLAFLIGSHAGGLDDGARTASIWITVIFYIIYLISACTSPMFSYLFNKHGAESIHEYMKKLFYNPPIMEFHAECYHYVTRHHTSRDSKGNVRHRTTREKVVTHRETERFSYYTWRDISGIFLLDSQKVFQGEKKTYIKLELGMNVEFADDISRMDYQRQKDAFYNRNRWRDTHISLHETTRIDGFNQYNMVRISDRRPPCVNGYMYLFFAFILPFLEFYKMYVDAFCIDQDYSIKKVLSTRYNLLQEEHSRMWSGCVPQLIIFNQAPVAYNEAPMPMHDTPILPSLEELNTAKTFTHQVSFNSQPNENYTPHFDAPQNDQNNQTGSVPLIQNFEQPNQMYSSMGNIEQPNYNPNLPGYSNQPADKTNVILQIDQSSESKRDLKEKLI